MSNKVLVTGGAGYIGSHIVIKLIETGYCPIILDNFSNSSRRAITQIEKLTQSSIIYYDYDIRSSIISKIFDEHNIYCVIHLAGVKLIEESLRDPLLYYDINVNGTTSLLKAMKNKCSRFIFSSTATVYDLTHESCLSEESSTNPATPYADSKLTVEKILKFLPDVHSVSLRYFNPIGLHPSGILQDNSIKRNSNIMTAIVDVLSGKREHLQIFGTDYNTRDGTAIRDYIHISDVADAHIEVLNNIDKINVDVLNIGSGQGYTVNEIITEIRKIVGDNFPAVASSRRNGDYPAYYANISKIQDMLNWRPQRNLGEICESLIVNTV